MEIDFKKYKRIPRLVKEEKFDLNSIFEEVINFREDGKCCNKEYALTEESVLKEAIILTMQKEREKFKKLIKELEEKSQELNGRVSIKQEDLNNFIKEVLE